MDESILRSKVNAFLAAVFVGSFALGAILLVWSTALGHNPLADAFAKIIVSENQLH